MGMGVAVPEAPPRTKEYTKTITWVPPSRAALRRKLYFLNHPGRYLMVNLGLVTITLDAKNNHLLAQVPLR